MRDDYSVRAALGQLDALHGLGERADLVDLDQDRVADTLLDAAAEPVNIGHEEIIAHQLDPVLQRLGQVAPPAPIASGQAILDRHNRVAVDPPGVEIDHFLRAATASIAL